MTHPNLTGLTERFIDLSDWFDSHVEEELNKNKKATLKEMDEASVRYI